MAIYVNLLFLRVFPYDHKENVKAFTAFKIMIRI